MYTICCNIKQLHIFFELNNSIEQSPSPEGLVRKFPLFYDTRKSIILLKDPAACLDPEPDQSSPRTDSPFELHSARKICLCFIWLIQITTYYCSEHNYPVDLYKGKGLCSLWGTNQSFIHGFD